MINEDFIREHIVSIDRYAIGHNASGSFLGVGMIYYALAYTYQSKISVCLGSGCGFVPKIMRQAQRDLCIADSRTILVDSDAKGDTDYYHLADYSFTKHFDVEIIKQTTQNALTYFKDVKIDFLHIDADHHYDCVKADFMGFKTFLSKKSVVTIHDTEESGVITFLKELAPQYNVCIIPFGAGTAIVTKSQINKTIYL